MTGSCKEHTAMVCAPTTALGFILNLIQLQEGLIHPTGPLRREKAFLFFRCNFYYFLTFIVTHNGINGMSFFSVNIPRNYKHQTCFKEHRISPKRLNAKCNIILDIFIINYTSWSSLTVLMSKLTHSVCVCARARLSLFLPYSVDDPRWFVHSATLHWNSFTRCWLSFTKWEEQSAFFEWQYYRVLFADLELMCCIQTQ